MSRRDTSNELSVQSLLDDAKELPRQPDAVRARVLARARATAAAPPPSVSVPAPPSRFPPQLVGAAAAAALVGSIVGSVLALGGGWPRHEPAGVAPAVPVPSQPLRAPAPSPSSAAPPVAPPAAGSPSSERSPPADSAERVTSAPPGKARREDAQASYAAELELMRSAHTAYAAHDYTSALVLVGEHARRFPGGLLSEEREALRVRCLLGAGRKTQARLAVESFVARFPRSVLVHRLEAEVGASAR